MTGRARIDARGDGVTSDTQFLNIIPLTFIDRLQFVTYARNVNAFLYKELQMSLNEIGLNLKWSQFDHLVIPVQNVSTLTVFMYHTSGLNKDVS